MQGSSADSGTLSNGASGALPNPLNAGGFVAMNNAIRPESRMLEIDSKEPPPAGLVSLAVCTCLDPCKFINENAPASL